MGLIGQALLNKWLQAPNAQPVTPAETPNAAQQVGTGQPVTQPQSGWDWLSSQGQQMIGNVSDSVLQVMQQRYPYFGQNGALNFTKNGPWRR